MAAWLLNQNPRPCDQYPKKLNSQKAVNCRQLSNKGSFYIDSTHISFIFGSIFVDECRLLPCVYLCIILTFKYQLLVSY